MSDTSKKILIVCTNHARIEHALPTGLWLEELTVAFGVFESNKFGIKIASPDGGEVPIDPRSRNEGNADFDPSRLADTAPVALLDLSQYAAVYFPGGHGAMFDLPTNPSIKRTVEHFFRRDQYIAAVCHGVAALVSAVDENKISLVKDRELTSFTDAEEHAAGMVHKMPFLLQSRLEQLGARFQAKENWSENVVVNGRLLTGQNPQSTRLLATTLVMKLSE